MRGSTAIALSAAAGAALFAAAGGVSYAIRSREPDGPRTVTEWVAGAVRPPAAKRVPADGKAVVAKYGCLGCHVLEGAGGRTGPALDGVGGRRTPDELRTWLRDPQAQKPGALMPRFPFTPDEERVLVDYLSSLEEARP